MCVSLSILTLSHATTMQQTTLKTFLRIWKIFININLKIMWQRGKLAIFPLSQVICCKCMSTRKNFGTCLTPLKHCHALIGWCKWETLCFKLTREITAFVFQIFSDVYPNYITFWCCLAWSRNFRWPRSGNSPYLQGLFTTMIQLWLIRKKIRRFIEFIVRLTTQRLLFISSKRK